MVILTYMKIAVTKLAEKSEGIPELFKQYGHEAIIIPTMRAAPPTDPAPLSRMAEMVSKGKIDILIFTSALGVDIFLKKLEQICVHHAETLRVLRPKPNGSRLPHNTYRFAIRGHALQRRDSGRSSAVYKLIPKNVRIVSVGPKTAKKVEEYGLKSEVIEKFSSDNFAQHLGDIKGKTIGIARAEVPNSELTSSLISRGATIIEAPAYRLVPGNSIVGVLEDADAVIFTSARSFELSGFNKDHARKIKVIAIGQKTADTMRKLGIEPELVGNGTLENCLALIS